MTGVASVCVHEIQVFGRINWVSCYKHQNTDSLAALRATT